MATEELVFIDPESGFEIRPWPEARDAEAAALLGLATPEGTPEAGQAAIAAARGGGPGRVMGGLLNGQLVGAYTLLRNGMANEIGVIAVAEGARRRGIGRALLQDALRRSGRRPLSAECGDAALVFYKACGFKLVSRKTVPTGGVRYRLGWHAPGAGFKGGLSGKLKHAGITIDDDCR